MDDAAGLYLVRTTAAVVALLYNKRPRQISFTGTCQYLLASWTDLASPTLNKQMAISAIMKADPGAIIEMDATGNVSETLIRGQGITDDVLSHLKSFPEVNSVLVANSEITDAGLVHLKGMTKLSTLAIHGSQITDAGPEHLKGLVDLRKLSISEYNVTGDGLVHLKKLSSLEELNLCATEVTDAKLTHLAGLSKLKSLYLDGYWVTDEGAKSLKKVLPNVTITLNKDFRLKLIKDFREGQRKKLQKNAKGT